MTILNNEEDILKIKDSGRIIREIFVLLKKLVKEGISTKQIDIFVEEYIRDNGAEPAFKGYRGFPGSICASVNDVVVHGIPSDRIILKSGDIIGIDVGVKKNGFFTDAARTYPVGKISSRAQHLIDVTRTCLEEGIKEAVAGNRVSDISHSVEAVARKEKLKEVRTFVGHGVGYELHEAPEVPNWGKKGRGPVLKEGLVLAIEPMINTGTREVKILDDGWTAVTEDGGLSAHFENTVIVGREKAEIIT